MSAAKAALSPQTSVGKLKIVNLHTGERFHDVFREGGTYVPDAIAELEVVLRDHRTGDTHPIDPRLFDWMASLRSRLEGKEFGIISGYRSPKTNAMLQANSNGVAKRSKHMDGKAIDLRLSGVDTFKLRQLAIKDQRGGVGYYAKSDFVHLDTGRPRFW
ncbi:MAG: DUF882 domain-containing protein [Alphaproteobacteria bacterium]|nr:DUF882 domain-containing protein [Alphaproteobacteria bacterium]